jgi:hypothetical protein
MANKEPNRQKGQPEEPGSNSFSGSTSTDPQKARLQTVKGNELGKDSKEDEQAGEPLRREQHQDDDIFDTGYMRSAAFPRQRPGQRK